MVVLTQLAAVVAGFSAIASAAPMHPANRHHKAFSVNQVARKTGKHRSVNAAGMYARALSKFGAKVPANVLAAAGGQGSVTTTPEQYDEAYLTPVTVGDSTLHLDIDTGSADLWVFSTELPVSEQAGHSLYEPSANAEELPGYTWDISYGDGSSASGNVFLDVVTVGGVTAQSQAVEAAEQVSSEFVNDAGTDGLMGLAFSSINTVQPVQQTTFFDTVLSQLNEPVFAADLKHDAPGTYDFGFVDTSKFTGSVAYTSVDNSQGFWMFTADGYSFGNAGSNGNSIQGIADTGTTLILLDDSIVEAYYNQISGAENNSQAGGYTLPCSVTPPDFNLQIGDYMAVVPGSYMIYAPLSSGSSTCFGGIQSNSGIGFSIFGDVFLKSQYVVFDASGPQIGFAAQS